jgi:S-adenosylmethionine hydrolase
MGVPIKKLGPTVAQNKLMCLSISKACISDNGDLVGSIVSIDHFGNLITNINLDDLAMIDPPVPGKNLCIHVGSEEIIGLSPYYSSANLGHPLAIMGSRGYLEISVNGGSAVSHFNVVKNDVVRINTVK